MFHQAGMREHAKLKISVMFKALTTARSGSGCHLNAVGFESGSARKACIAEILVFILKMMTHRFHGGGLI